MLFDVVNLLFMVTGNTINVLALLANALATPKSLRLRQRLLLATLQDYSIIIFNTSLNDLILMMLHSLIHARFGIINLHIQKCAV